MGHYIFTGAWQKTNDNSGDSTIILVKMKKKEEEKITIILTSDDDFGQLHRGILLHR